MNRRSQGIVTKFQGCSLRGAGGPDPVVVILQRIVEGPSALLYRTLQLALTAAEIDALVEQLHSCMNNLDEGEEPDDELLFS